MSNSSNKHNPLSPQRGSSSYGSDDDPLEERDAGISEDDPGVSFGAPPPQTRCVNCQTVFEVSPELLVSNDTRVRCGECLSIFDALINLRRDTSPMRDGRHADDDDDRLSASSEFSSAIHSSGAEGGKSDPNNSKVATDMQGSASALDITYSDFDLFSGEAALPDVAYFDQTQDLDSLRFDEPDGDETFSDTLFAHDMTVEAPEHDGTIEHQSPALEPSALDAQVDFVTDDVQSEPVVFTYRDPEDEPIDKTLFTRSGEQSPSEPLQEIELAPVRRRRKSRSPWVARIVLGFLIVVITASLYGYRSRASLLQDPDIRPWIANACALIGCELKPLVDLDALKQLKRTVFAHPTNEKELVIDLAFVNEATFDQPYPVLQIRLTNRNGALIVQNKVTPAEYLDDWQPEDLLGAGERLDLSLTFEDPGQTATYAELKFLQ